MSTNEDLIRRIFYDPWFTFGLFIVQIIIVVTLSAAVMRFCPIVAFLLFLGYAAVTGVTISSIFIYYSTSTIAYTFWVAAGMFLFSSVVGLFIKRDLSGIGMFLLFALMGWLFAWVFTWFLPVGSGFNQVMNFTGILLFAALTVWDIHRLKLLSIPLVSFGYDPTQLGFPPSVASQAQSVSFPYINLSGYAPIGPARSGGNIRNFSDNWAVGETLAKVMGSHSVKFGGEARLMLNNQSGPQPSLNITTSDAFTRANPLTASTSSGDSLASFLLGCPSAVSSTYQNFPAQGQRFYALFFHDDWRVSSKLTLNMGVRWEYESPITDRFDHQIRAFDTSTTSNLGSATGPTVRGGLLFADKDNRFAYKRDLNNFAPRFGFAYWVASKLVLRGGYSITYAPTASISPTTGSLPGRGGTLATTLPCEPQT